MGERALSISSSFIQIFMFASGVIVGVLLLVTDTDAFSAGGVHISQRLQLVAPRSGAAGVAGASRPSRLFTRTPRHSWTSPFARVGAAALLGALTPFGAAFAVTSAPASFGSVPLTARVLFALKQFLLKRAGLIIVLGIVGCVMLGGLLFKLTAQTTLGEGTFRAYSLLNNVPGADATCDDTPLGRLVANALYMVGVGTFALVIGFLSDGISSSVEGLRVSNERVLEVRHTVLLNWGEQTGPILRQLEAARREGRLSGPVVILSERDKDEMDKDVQDELAKAKGSAAGLTVLTRSGSPVELANIDRAAAGTAKRVILLTPQDTAGRAPQAASDVPSPQASSPTSPAGGEGGGAVGAADVRLRSSTGLLMELQAAVNKKSAKRADVVVSAPHGYHNGVAAAPGTFGSYSEVSPDDFVSRVIAQCTVQAGLSHVYDELLLQGAGCELYARPLAGHRALHGRTFGDVRTCFGRATVIGVTSATETVLAPADDTVLKEGDSLILIADKAADTKPTGKPRKTRVTAASTAVNEQVGVVRPKPSATPKSLLLLNVDESMPDLVKQIDEVLPKGSKITLLAPTAPKATFALHHSNFRHIKGDPTSSDDLKAAGIEGFDAVVCLQPGGGSDADDSRLLVSLRGMQQALRESVDGQGDDATGAIDGLEANLEAAARRMPRVVSEVRAHRRWYPPAPPRRHCGHARHGRVRVYAHAHARAPAQGHPPSMLALMHIHTRPGTCAGALPVDARAHRQPHAVPEAQVGFRPPVRARLGDSRPGGAAAFRTCPTCLTCRPCSAALVAASLALF